MLLVYEGESLCSRHELRDEGATVIAGRGEECQIRIGSSSQPLASRTHVRFDHSWGGCAVTDTSRNGVWVNGTQIDGTRMLEDGDCVTFAGPDTRHVAARVVFRLLASAADAPDRAMPPARTAPAPIPARNHPVETMLHSAAPASSGALPPVFIAPPSLLIDGSAPAPQETHDARTGKTLERVAMILGALALLALIAALFVSC
jgi:hypothetical protein